MSFAPAKAKLTIGSLDDSTTVSAQYNPKELQIDQSVPWSKKNAANQANSAEGGSSEGGIELEFTGAEGRTMSVELLFDGYEGGDRAVDVAGEIKKLETMASVRFPKDPDEDKRRPHRCVISWGERGMPSFKCVIESISTKYSMFSSDGVPLRATCTVKLKEADKVSAKKGG